MLPEGRPVPDTHSKRMALEWAVGEPEPLRSHPYTDYSPETTPARDVLFTTRTVDPVAAAAEARWSGLWASTEITDTLWPARDTRTRPLMPLRRGHMAMLVPAGFLDNLCLEADGRRILVKGPPRRTWSWWRTARRRRSTGRSSRPPSSPWTCTAARSPTSQHRRLTSLSRTHEALLVPSTCGAFALPERFRNTHKGNEG